jgi:alanine dehydrogenase
MTLYLTEGDVHGLLNMRLALEAVEDSFRRQAEGRAMLHSRQRLHIPGESYLHYMAAADAAAGYMGLKIYTSSREGLRCLVPLFNTRTGDLAAMLEADYLGQVRTGAASGVATRYMARADARVAAFIGTGLQARTQLEAVALVRELEAVRVFGRNEEKRKRFAREMGAALKLRVEAVDTAEKAVREADIIVTATTAAEPVVEGGWIKPGAHINAIGANFPNKRELDEAAVNRAGLIAVDSREQSKMEAGDLIHTFKKDQARWNSVIELSEIVSGQLPGRLSAEQVTLFKSNGIATEDVAVGARIYELAKSRGVGRDFPCWEEKRKAADRNA